MLEILFGLEKTSQKIARVDRSLPGLIDSCGILVRILTCNSLGDVFTTSGYGVEIVANYSECLLFAFSTIFPFVTPTIFGYFMLLTLHYSDQFSMFSSFKNSLKMTLYSQYTMTRLLDLVIIASLCKNNSLQL